MQTKQTAVLGEDSLNALGRENLCERQPLTG